MIACGRENVPFLLLCPHRATKSFLAADKVSKCKNATVRVRLGEAEG